mmetsp:Transcript_15808/g.40287  ORF Transcript_15808/g.40287 Transcript_15808/m.40287 type:complete len:246 (+) Transcript_15808:1549-2286(+)
MKPFTGLSTSRSSSGAPTCALPASMLSSSTLSSSSSTLYLLRPFALASLITACPSHPFKQHGESSSTSRTAPAPTYAPMSLGESAPHRCVPITQAQSAPAASEASSCSKRGLKTSSWWKERFCRIRTYDRFMPSSESTITMRALGSAYARTSEATPLPEHTSKRTDPAPSAGRSLAAPRSRRTRSNMAYASESSFSSRRRWPFHRRPLPGARRSSGIHASAKSACRCALAGCLRSTSSCQKPSVQ